MTLILASSSPRRRELLARLGVSFQVEPSSIDERRPRPAEDAASYAQTLASKKADEVASRFPGAVILAADTVVTVDGKILGKPVDAGDALRMLRLLRGRRHTVITGVAIRGVLSRGEVVAAAVRMRDSLDSELEAYVASGEPMDKAGAYAVQGLGGTLVEEVYGCLETVIGLPICLCRDLLAASGIHVAASSSCRHFPNPDSGE